MRISPLLTASLYFGLGTLFTYIAVVSAQDTLWNIFTIALIIFATLDFGVAIRLIGVHIKIQKQKKK
ncbi:YdiK family protein [Radiobacillus sp. PE A8.2]|uniref:YdiK family protein n=1 Tax=Radiobacillus sp. PE A8.2 TaxID=3380349 RepID=UPI00388D85E4